jgi:hypothetical protein
MIVGFFCSRLSQYWRCENIVDDTPGKDEVRCRCRVRAADSTELVTAHGDTRYFVLCQIRGPHVMVERLPEPQQQVTSGEPENEPKIRL